MNWKRRIILLASGLAAFCALSAVQTTTPSSADYSYFKIIADRNIFNPNRRPHVIDSYRPPASSLAARAAPAVDTLSLVGTMSYENGTYAFFDGSSAEYKKVLKCNGEIAGFKVSAIAPAAVVLSNGNKRFEVRVGAQLCRDGDSGWHLTEVPVQSLVAQTNGPAASAPVPPGVSNFDQNDVLKKLMQQRERELK
jgi:hypothetical protein